jgi:hypothetical protein
MKLINIIYLTGFGVVLSGCTSENTKYASKEDEAAILMKECSHNPSVDFTKLANAWQLTNTYLNNCNPKTSPSTAIYIGINPYYNR